MPRSVAERMERSSVSRLDHGRSSISGGGRLEHQHQRASLTRLDRSSLSRASVGKGSLGRFSVATDISAASSAATRHWVNSVSDIYGPDEIEDLLQDLHRLELASLDTEDYREFEGLGGGQDSMALRCLPYRATAAPLPLQQQQLPDSSSSSCAATPPPPPLVAGAAVPSDSPVRLRPSPAHSVRSWDSHTHYHQFKGGHTFSLREVKSGESLVAAPLLKDSVLKVSR